MIIIISIYILWYLGFQWVTEYANFQNALTRLGLHNLSTKVYFPFSFFILQCTVVETPGRGVLEDFENSFSGGGCVWYLVRVVKISIRVPEVSVLLLEKFPFSLISFSFEKDFIKPYKVCLLNRRSLSVLHLSPSFWSIELRHQGEPEGSIFSFSKIFFPIKMVYTTGLWFSDKIMLK